MPAYTIKKNIFYLVDDYGACGWYRCHTPGMELQRRGHDVVLDHAIRPEHVDWADIIVFQRQWRTEALRAMQYALSTGGKLVVYELDDDLWNIHPTNPSWKPWNTPEIIGAAEAMLRDAHVVTTTTEPLEQQLRKFSDNIRVLPNMLPQEVWHAHRERPAGSDTISIGWAGSVSRAMDLAVVRNVIPQLLDGYPNVEMLLVGHESNMVFPPHERLFNVHPVKIEEYDQLLARFDIGLAPVVDSRFNQAKSDLKYVEYGMVGVPCVASNVEAYAHTVLSGENGFLAKNDKGWLKYLRRLIESEDLRRQIAGAAQELAETRTIDKNIWRWERAYGLVESKVPA